VEKQQNTKTMFSVKVNESSSDTVLHCEMFRFLDSSLEASVPNIKLLNEATLKTYFWSVLENYLLSLMPTGDTLYFSTLNMRCG